MEKRKRGAGDTVHVVQRVKEMREASKSDRGVLTFQKELVNQREEVVQTGTTTVLLAKRKTPEGN